jgi:hypothetical protein
MVYFQTENVNLGKFLRDLLWKRLVYVKAIWSILWAFGIGKLWLHIWNNLLVIWYICWLFGTFVVYLVYSPRFGKYYREKSGNPESQRQHRKSHVRRVFFCSPGRTPTDPLPRLIPLCARQAVCFNYANENLAFIIAHARQKL